MILQADNNRGLSDIISGCYKRRRSEMENCRDLFSKQFPFTGKNV